MKKILSISSAMIFHDEKLLMLLRDDKLSIPNPNTWSLIGGVIEDNETPLEAMKREAKEEISVIPSELTYIGKLFRDRYRYFAHLTDGEKNKLKLGNEGQEIRFFEIDKLLNVKTNPRLKKWIESHLNKIKYLSTTPTPNSDFIKELEF